MEKKIKILSVFGTRPEAIKMATVVRELEGHRDMIESKVAVTAQHREMLDQVLRVFAIEPDYDLDVMKPGQDLFDVTEAVLAGLKPILERERPDMLVVQGDTTTTFAGALAAFYFQIPVGHVEAGLRTYEKYAPFPEEINRVLTTHLADLHFAPTNQAREALLKEGVAAERVFVTGNPVIDALHLALQQPYCLEPELERAFTENKRVILLTTHRRENLGSPLQEIYLALRDLLYNYPDLAVVFPVHKNPKVRQEVAQVLQGLDRVYLTEPLDYLPFINVEKRAHLVLTDSGGIQEEAPALGKPVLVLRDVTERPEAIVFGTARLVGTNRHQVEENVARLLDSREAYDAMANAVNPYGDGQAAPRIVQAIRSYFHQAPPPEEFRPESRQYQLSKARGQIPEND
ncbi:MAG: UDP-N-acetylglucosamine 2-epimerase (non-hydrolyzing) [Thermacetogeniaceae bacterium]